MVDFVEDNEFDDVQDDLSMDVDAWINKMLG